MSRTIRHDLPEDGDRPFMNRVFGVGFRRKTYANMAYLLARFPLCVAYFATFIAGLSVGLPLVPLVVGVPILVGVLALAGYVRFLESYPLRSCGAKRCSTLPPTRVTNL